MHSKSECDFQLTLPSAVENWLRAFLEQKSDGINIIEYGTGGSSFLFTENPKNFLVAGETDKNWLKQLIGEMVRLKRFNILPAYMNIGETKEWGMPRNPINQRNFFPTAIRHPTDLCAKTGLTPDFIFIDGRFRVACFCESYLRSPTGTPIMIDDYFDRPEYHIVEKLVPIYSKIGRAALFLRPNRPATAIDMREFTSYYINPD